jgi:hypothetical protein
MNTKIQDIYIDDGVFVSIMPPLDRTTIYLYMYIYNKRDMDIPLSLYI